jgi:hypothetical protein
MALVTKIEPKGIDLEIDYFQRYLYTYLGYSDSDYESYHRVYLNPRNRSSIVEAYIGRGEYKEVLFDDTFSMTSFFLVDDIANFDDKIEINVSLIIQANLQELFPGVTHRADEELHRLIELASKEYTYYDMWTLTNRVTGASNVYSEIDFTQTLLDDMSEKHYVRYTYLVKYSQTC